MRNYTDINPACPVFLTRLPGINRPHSLAAMLFKLLPAAAHLTSANKRKQTHKNRLTSDSGPAYALSRRCKFNGTGLAARNEKADTATRAVFLCPQHGSTCNGRCRVGGLRACRLLFAGLLTHTVPPSLFSSGEAVNKPQKRYPAMTQRHTLTLNPFKSLAARYRAKALSALHADSSLPVRLARYNAAITKARQLEALASTTKPAQAGGAA